MNSERYGFTALPQLTAIPLQQTHHLSRQGLFGLAKDKIWGAEKGKK